MEISCPRKDDVKVGQRTKAWFPPADTLTLVLPFGIDVMRYNCPL